MLARIDGERFLKHPTGWPNKGYLSNPNQRGNSNDLLNVFNFKGGHFISYVHKTVCFYAFVVEKR